MKNGIEVSLEVRNSVSAEVLGTGNSPTGGNYPMGDFPLDEVARLDDLETQEFKGRVVFLKDTVFQGIDARGSVKVTGDVDVSGKVATKGDVDVSGGNLVVSQVIKEKDGSTIKEGGYVTANHITTNSALVGNLEITGDVIQRGESFVTHAEKVEIEDNKLIINKGEIGSGVSAGESGIEIDRGFLTNYEFVFSEQEKSFKIGETGFLQSVATREGFSDSPSIPYWDVESNSFRPTSVDKDKLFYIKGLTSDAQLQLNEKYAKTGGDINGDVTVKGTFIAETGAVLKNKTKVKEIESINNFVPNESGFAINEQGDAEVRSITARVRAFVRDLKVFGGALVDTLTASVKIKSPLVESDDLNSSRAKITQCIDAQSIVIRGDATISGNAILANNIGSNDFVSKLEGWQIDGDGNAEMKGLRLREFLDVPELRYNRVSVIAGEQWSAPGGGIVERVNEETGVVTLKLEPGEVMAVDMNDLCKGEFYCTTGFETIFFQVTKLGNDNRSFEYTLRPGCSLHPQEMMHFVAYGNKTNKDRQCSAVITQRYTQYLRGVNDWNITSDMIAMQLGDLTDLSIDGRNLDGYSAYLDRVYMKGTIKQLSGDGLTEVPVPAFVGEWMASRKYYYYDEVTYDGSRWICVDTNSVGNTPADGNSTWLKVVSKGDTGDKGEGSLPTPSYRLQSSHTEVVRGLNGVCRPDRVGCDVWMDVDGKREKLMLENLATVGYYGNSSSEYCIGTIPLSSPLIPGRRYAISFYYNFTPYEGAIIPRIDWVQPLPEITNFGGHYYAEFTPDGNYDPRICLFQNYNDVPLVSIQLGIDRISVKDITEQIDFRGRNWVVGASMGEISPSWHSGGWCPRTNLYYDSLDQAFSIKAVNGWQSGQYRLPDFLIGQTVTIEAMVRGVDITQLFYFGFSNGKDWTTSQEIPLSKRWKKVSYTTTLNDSGYIGFFVMLTEEGKDYQAIVQMREIAIYRGNAETEYSPAPEDVTLYVDNNYVDGGSIANVNQWRKIVTKDISSGWYEYTGNNRVQGWVFVYGDNSESEYMYPTPRESIYVQDGVKKLILYTYQDTAVADTVAVIRRRLYNGWSYNVGDVVIPKWMDSVDFVLSRGSTIFQRKDVPVVSDGVMPRNRGVWTANTSYVYGGGYRDFVLHNGETWFCEESHVSGSAWDAAYWEASNEFKNIATELLLADNGRIDVLGSQQLFVGDVDGNTGWVMTDGSIHHNSGLELSSDGKLKVPNSGCIEVEGDLVASLIRSNGLNVNEKFKVDKDGNFTATGGNIEGCVTATSGNIGCLEIQMDGEGRAKLSANSDGAVVDIIPSEVISARQVPPTQKVTLTTSISLPLWGDAYIYRYTTSNDNYTISNEGTVVNGVLTGSINCYIPIRVSGNGLTASNYQEVAQTLFTYHIKSSSYALDYEVGGFARQINCHSVTYSGYDSMYESGIIEMRMYTTISFSGPLTLFALSRTEKSMRLWLKGIQYTGNPVEVDIDNWIYTLEYCSPVNPFGNLRAGLWGLDSFTVQMQNRCTKLAANGAIVSKNGDNYFYVTNGLDDVTKGCELGFKGVIKKDSNIPYLIAGGEVGSGGNKIFESGRECTITKLTSEGNGIYTIQHKMGGLNYIPQITVSGNGGAYASYEKFTNELKVYIYNRSGGRENLNFSFMIYGVVQ